MSGVLAGLAVAAFLGGAAWVLPARTPAWLRYAAVAGAVLALGVSGLVATSSTEVSRVAAVVLAVVVAAVGGGPVTLVVLRLAASATSGAATTLRGGATIGVLERLAICATLLAGMPEGVAVVLAVKGLGRYPELRSPGTSERFIIGTFSSTLWAAACAGVGLLLLR